MEVMLRNDSRYLLTLTLNSGTTLHLAPGQTSGQVDDLEVNGNAKVEKLTNAGQLSVHTVEQPHAEEHARE